MKGLLEEDRPEQEEMPEVSPEAKPLLDEATALLYSENFENFVKMFQDGGQEGFAKSMAAAVTGTLDRLEKEKGELSIEIVAEVGSHLIVMITQDLVDGGVIDEVTSEMYMGAIAMVIGLWGKNNPGRASPQEFQQAAQQVDAQRGLQ